MYLFLGEKWYEIVSLHHDELNLGTTNITFGLDPLLLNANC